MKNSVYVLIGGFVLVSVVQPSQSPFKAITHNHFSPCTSLQIGQHVAADVLPERDQPLSEWIGEGNAISIVASGSDEPRFSITSRQTMSGTCQSVYSGPSSL